MSNRKQTESSVKAFVNSQHLGKSAETGIDLAKRLGVSRGLIVSARIIWEYGTKEEKQMAKSGAGLEPLADAIKKRLPPEEREKLRARNGTITKEFRQVAQTDVDLWARLNPVLHNLISLPRAEDMIAIITRNGAREKTVDHLIDSAANWMEEFYHAWTTRRRKPGGSATDSGGSDADVGVQHPEPPSQ